MRVPHPTFALLGRATAVAGAVLGGLPTVSSRLVELLGRRSRRGDAVEVQGLSWMGVRVADLAEAIAFFELLGLRHQWSEGEMAVLSARNGDTVEVFGPGDDGHRHFDTGPVVGFQVDDIEAARRELEAAGVEFVGPIERGGGLAWAHFYGPGRFLYELTGRG